MVMCPVDWAPFRDGRLKSTDFMPPQSMPSICFTRLDHSRPRLKKRAATLHMGFMRLHCVLVSKSWFPYPVVFMQYIFESFTDRSGSISNCRSFQIWMLIPQHHSTFNIFNSLAPEQFKLLLRSVWLRHRKGAKRFQQQPRSHHTLIIQSQSVLTGTKFCACSTDQRQAAKCLVLAASC